MRLDLLHPSRTVSCLLFCASATKLLTCPTQTKSNQIRPSWITALLYHISLHVGHINFYLHSKFLWTILLHTRFSYRCNFFHSQIVCIWERKHTLWWTNNLLKASFKWTWHFSTQTRQTVSSKIASHWSLPNNEKVYEEFCLCNNLIIHSHENSLSRW